MKILGEMKRRNVFRIGMAYIVASWVVIQIGYIIASNYGAPPWVMGVVITFVISGLPVVLFLTWTFAWTTDWTQERIRSPQSADPDPEQR